MNRKQWIRFSWTSPLSLLFSGVLGATAARSIDLIPPTFACAVAVWYFIAALAASFSRDLTGWLTFFICFVCGVFLWSSPFYATGLAWPGSGLIAAVGCTLLISLCCLLGCGYTPRACAFRWGLVMVMLVVLLISQGHLPWSGLFLVAVGFFLQAARSVFRQARETGKPLDQILKM